MESVMKMTLDIIITVFYLKNIMGKQYIQIIKARQH